MKKKQVWASRMKQLQILFIFLLVLTSFRFFGANFINPSLSNYAIFLSCLAAIALSVPFAFKKGSGFELPVRLIVIAIALSILMSYLSWGQGFKYSIIATVPLLLWIFFFYLLHIKVPVKTIETIVLIYAFIYLVLYFFQFLNPDVLFFGQLVGKAYDRGIFRIIFPGGGIFFLAVFMAINKLTTQKSGKRLWMLLSILGIVVSIMQATRQYVAGVIIIYLYHFLKGQPVKKALTIVAAVVGFVILITQFNIPVITGLMEAQETTAEQGAEDPRVKAGTYFLTEFSPNVISNILGNGVPAAADQSRYGKYVESLYKTDLFMEDVGIIGLFTMFGIVAVIGYIMIWVKSFKLPLPQGYYYVKYYLWFLLITCLTSDNVYSNYYLISTVFALYIFQTIYNEKKLKKEEKGGSPFLRYEYRGLR